MGLDWIVEPKPKSLGVDVSLINIQIDALQEKVHEYWREYLEALGEEEPCFYPNQLNEDFQKLPAIKALAEEMDQLSASKNEHFISPEETLGAPRIGVDEKASEWVKSNWGSLNTKDDEGNEIAFDDFITRHFGMFVVDAAEPTAGVASVSGIMVSATSFRGKVLGFVPWLPAKLVEAAYTDMSSVELEDYGNDLRHAVKEITAEPDSKLLGRMSPEEFKDSVELVMSASEWCLYWGGEGHSMHAWY